MRVLAYKLGAALRKGLKLPSAVRKRKLRPSIVMRPETNASKGPNGPYIKLELVQMMSVIL